MKDKYRILGWLLSRMTILTIGSASLVALLAMVIVTPIAPRRAYADHDSMYLVCPDPIREGDSGQMSIKKPGYRIVYATIFTHQGAYSAGPEDFEEYHGVKFETDSGENTLRVPIITKEDSAPEHDETFAIGFSNEGVWHQCMVTIEDDDAPEVTQVEILSQPADGYAYRAGESIDVMVSMDAKVEADGTPLPSLFLSDEADSTWRGAEYHSGSGGFALVFRYQVRSEDTDTDGISVSAAAVSDDRTAAYGFSGNIFAEGTDVPINYTHSGVLGDWRQMVDGRPYVQSSRVISAPPDGWDAYRANQIIEYSLTFNTDVVMEGDVSIDLYLGLDNYNCDEATRRASYTRGSGSDTLVFGYTVRPGDVDAKGIGLILGTEDNGFGRSGKIKAKGSDVERNPWCLGTGHQPEHKVDTEPPKISSVRVTSKPANGEAYLAGEAISVEVAFSETVTASGGEHLELDVGGVTREAILCSDPERNSSDSLVFQYSAQDVDTDSDGIGIGANGLESNGAGIYDSAGNAADLSHEAVAADSDQKVNAATGD